MLKNSRDIIKRLKDDGFQLIAMRGSHHKFRREGRVVVVTHPRKDIPADTVRSIYV